MPQWCGREQIDWDLQILAGGGHPLTSSYTTPIADGCQIGTAEHTNKGGYQREWRNGTGKRQESAERRQRKKSELRSDGQAGGLSHRTAQLPQKPSPRESPVPHDGIWGNLQYRGSLFDAETAEESKLNDPSLA